ncbi:flagellar hook-length control protein FliK [Oceanobacillus halotolerans]|uniref:flagellar hook-length control protein FliK n=1 Tax=Oceanobacillus halotolerans TaxID=2663380 RepID=UPI001CF7B250|nr:flagellar hook-length control protein FliK [Oceanobacillus halotolerans]
MAMVFQQLVPKQASSLQVQSSNLRKPVNNEGNAFGRLLGEMQGNESDDKWNLMELLSSLPDNVKDSVMDMLSQIENGEHSQLGELSKLLESSDFNKQEEVLKKLGTLLDNQMPIQRTENDSMLIGNPIMQKVENLISSDEQVQSELAALVKKIVPLLQDVQKASTLQDIQRIAPSILKLLEQWTALDKKLQSQQGSNTLIDTAFSKVDQSSKEQAIWKELIQAYQKRDQLVAKQQYNANATITSKDVVKWLQKAFSNQLANTENSNGVSFTTNAPMSRIEQYVIQVNPTQRSKSVDQQLINEFQKVMKTSQFLSMSNGNSQLAIRLQPDTLGDMMVRFTQVNGEMTVKILVSSVAAKEMLESNLHQLKNMFSPHQVTIERQDLQTQQSQNLNADQEDQSMSEQDQDQSNQFDESDEHREGEQEDFETQFQDILQKEEV